MPKYLFTIVGIGIGFGFLLKETYENRKKVNQRKELLQNLYKSNVIIDKDECIYEHNFNNDSSCHKIIIETYKIQDDNLSLNEKISFIHIESNNCIYNNNAKDLIKHTKFSSQVLNKIDAERSLTEKYRINLDDYCTCKGYVLVRVSIGSNIKRLYFYCKKFYNQNMIISYSDNLEILLDDIVKKGSRFYYYIGWMSLFSTFGLHLTLKLVANPCNYIR